MRNQTTLPTFESWLDKIAAAEQGRGWLSVCEGADRFLLPNRQLIASLAELLRPLDRGLVLEVCAGRGELAEALASAGISVLATDAGAPSGSAALRASAQQALERYRPAAVLGCFVPVDARVDETIMTFPSVRHYVVLGARIGGLFGSEALWQNSCWKAEPLKQVSRWMLTRHDVWIGSPKQMILQHGEAWHFRRNRKDDRNGP